MTNSNDTLHNILAVIEGAKHQLAHSTSSAGQALASASALDQIQFLILEAQDAEAPDGAEGAPSLFDILFGEDVLQDEEDDEPDSFESFLGGQVPDLGALFGGILNGGDEGNPIVGFLTNLPNADEVKAALKDKLPTEDQIDEALAGVNFSDLTEFLRRNK